MIKANRETILNNGLRVLFIEQKELKDSGLGISVPAGPCFESENNLGISHLTEHLISRLDVGGGNLRDAIYGKGGVFDASTYISQTYFFLYALNDDISECSKMLVKGIFEPKFREGALANARESIFSEMADSRRFSSYETLREMIWKDEKLKRPLMGKKETLLSVGLDDISGYHKQRYLSLGVSAVVVGPKFPDGLEEELTKIGLTDDKPKDAFSAEIKKPAYRIFEEGNFHSTLTLCFPTKGYKDLGEGRHLFRLAADVLSNTYVAALSGSGLIYQSDWSWNIFPDSGEFVLEFPDLATEHVLTVAKTALRLFDDWSNLTVGVEEFELIKKQRILAVRMVEGLGESLPLITKDFSSSEEAHTFEEAVGVYEKATLKETLNTAKKILLTGKPFLVMNMGDDSLKYTEELKSFLDSFYSNQS